MATMSDEDCRRLYSWWWDSHISPKNSKWLQDNLTDMDVKVKTMIKLIEEDADSFARRAEMYYQKRPELMKLVEEFYRAYRALAERYDLAIRQAHDNIAAAFPDQLPLVLSEEFQKLDDETISHPDSEGMKRIEKEIETFKQSLSKLEAEKETGQVRYDQTIERLMRLESGFSSSQEDSRDLNERASKAEVEVQILREILSKLQDEKEENLLQYQHCLERISNLADLISRANEDVRDANNRATEVETKVEVMRRDLASLESEKDAVLVQYEGSLEKIAVLEHKLLLAEADARKVNERAENAEREVELLKLALANFTEESDRIHSKETERALQTLMTHLQDENMNLKESFERERREKNAFLEKNAVLENLLVELSVKKMEGSFQSLQEEKSTLLAENATLMTQLLATNERNVSLENSLSDLKAKCEEKESRLSKVHMESFQVVTSALDDMLRNTGRKLQESEAQNCQKEMKISEAECRISALEKMVDDQNKKVLDLSRTSNSLSETNSKLESELHRFKKKEEALSSNVQKLKNESNLWETVCSSFYEEQQVGSISKTLMEEKIHELTEACTRLGNEVTSKCTETALLKDRLSILEDESKRYTPGITSLKDAIASLENITSQGRKPSGSGSCSSSSEEVSGDPKDDLEDLHWRVKAIEKAVVEMESLAAHKTMDANAKLEAAMRQVGQLSLKCGSKQQKPMFVPVSDISDISMPENGLLLSKDIMLDRVSRCSPRSLSKKEYVVIDSQMIDKWNTTFDLKVATHPNIPLSSGSVKKKSTREEEYPTSEESTLLLEKELSRRFSGSRREIHKRKILDRLDSDAQKLGNLHITVEDLKRKMETMTDKNSQKVLQASNSEWEMLKEQLEEAEAAVLMFLDQNSNMMEVIEQRYSFSSEGGKCGVDQSKDIRRTRIPERSRKLSEKIGQLQLEVQKLQFILLKLDERRENRGGKTRMMEVKRRVLLKDYLGGNGRTSTSQKKKKTSFCACVQPPTRGE